MCVIVLGPAREFQMEVKGGERLYILFCDPVVEVT